MMAGSRSSMLRTANLASSCNKPNQLQHAGQNMQVNISVIYREHFVLCCVTNRYLLFTHFYVKYQLQINFNTGMKSVEIPSRHSVQDGSQSKFAKPNINIPLYYIM